MRIPDESLDDFNISAAPNPAGPPAARRVRPSGLVEVVRPLVRLEDFAKSEAAAESALLPPGASGGPQRLSWFHQSLAVCGSFALIALFLVAGLFIGISERPTGPAPGSSDVAMSRQPDDMFTSAEEPFNSDRFADENSPSVSDELRVVRPAARRMHARPRLSLAVYRPRRRPLPPQYVVSQFVPTTLVIYAENGEIKTRIEPWLTAGYKKPLAFPN